jgi:hypothetical protein
MTRAGGLSSFHDSGELIPMATARYSVPSTAYVITPPPIGAPLA